MTTTFPEDTDTIARIKVADIVVNDDALGTNTLALSGADAALFEIDGTELYLKASASLDHETKTTLAITVDVDDAALLGTPGEHQRPHNHGERRRRVRCRSDLRCQWRNQSAI